MVVGSLVKEFADVSADLRSFANQTHIALVHPLFKKPEFANSKSEKLLLKSLRSINGSKATVSLTSDSENDCWTLSR